MWGHYAASRQQLCSLGGVPSLFLVEDRFVIPAPLQREQMDQRKKCENGKYCDEDTACFEAVVDACIDGELYDECHRANHKGE